MLTWMDRQQQLLADEITPDTNTVGHVMKQIYLDTGGLATTNESSDLALSQRIANIANQGTTNIDKSAAGKYPDSPLGAGFYNSPAYIAQHFSQMGKFFSGADVSAHRYDVNYKSPPLKSEDPNDFYAQWYLKMRQFSEAREVAGQGEAEVRTR